MKDKGLIVYQQRKQPRLPLERKYSRYLFYHFPIRARCLPEHMIQPCRAASASSASRSRGRRNAGSSVTASREVEIGKFPLSLTANLSGHVNATGDMALIVPSYVFAARVLGGQAAISVTGLYGHSPASLAATLSGTLNGSSFSRSDSISDSVTGFGDLYPQFSLRWNAGVHNFMTYMTGDVPVGAYDSTRLANLGIGHGAVDGGVGYTYFNPKTGHEFSVVTGLTGNFENPTTHYQNGLDFHVDWGASQFLSKQLHVGLVGYDYEQVTGDSGPGARLGSFKSRVNAIGPQIGYLFPVGDMQGYLNLKGYKEFAAENRTEGWNAWLTFSISPSAPSPGG